MKRLWVFGVLPLLGVSWVAAQPAHLDTWSIARTDHFSIYSDAGEARVAEIAASLELFRAVFSQLAPELDLDFHSPAYFFAFRDGEAYAPYRSGGDSGGVTLGQFLSHRDVNYVTLNADPAYLGSFAVIFHEYVHYFVRQNFPGVPRWFNEGLAEYYSTFAVEGDRAVVGRPVERHVRWLARNAELRLEEVLSFSGDSESFNEASKAGRFYAVSWVLVHYLLSGGEERAEQLATFLSDVAPRRDPRSAFEAAFDLRLSDLEDELRGYLLGASLPVAAILLENLPASGRVELAPAPPADLLVDLGELLARMGRDVEAERHLRLALDYQPTHPDAHAGLAYVRQREQRIPEAEQLYRDAIRLGSVRALTYLLYGRHLLAAAQSGGLGGPDGSPAALASRARDAFQVAVGFDSDFAEARAMLGYSHLFGELDPGQGIPHLVRAAQELVGRSDLVFHLMQLCLRDDQVARAQSLVDHELARFGDQELVVRAQEEIRRWVLIQGANEALAAGEYERGLRLLDEAVSVTTDPTLRARLLERLDGLERRLAGVG